MKDCIFCKIVNKEIPADVVHETENMIVFKDVEPKSKIHLLIIPKKHILDMRTAPVNIWSEIQEIAIALEKKNKLTGFVLATNVGDRALIKHMHIHFLDKTPKLHL